MQLTLSTEKGTPLKPTQLKEIAEAIGARVGAEGKFEAYIAWAALPKMRFLNRTWRGLDKPTNVLSYPQFEPAELAARMKKRGRRETLNLGDIVLCLPYLKTEARQLKKPVNNHIAHLVVHGVLHLLGYDHIVSRKANRMEKLEKDILADLGVPDPYTEDPVAAPDRKTAAAKKQL